MVMIAQQAKKAEPQAKARRARTPKPRKAKVRVVTTTDTTTETVTTTTRTVSTTTATVYAPTLFVPAEAPPPPPEDHRLGTAAVYATECRCCRGTLPTNEFHAYGAVCENCWVGEQDVKGKARKYKGQSAAERYRMECENLFM